MFQNVLYMFRGDYLLKDFFAEMFDGSGTVVDSRYHYWLFRSPKYMLVAGLATRLCVNGNAHAVL